MSWNITDQYKEFNWNALQTNNGLKTYKNQFKRKIGFDIHLMRISEEIG